MGTCKINCKLLFNTFNEANIFLFIFFFFYETKLKIKCTHNDRKRKKYDKLNKKNISEESKKIYIYKRKKKK